MRTFWFLGLCLALFSGALCQVEKGDLQSQSPEAPPSVSVTSPVLTKPDLGVSTISPAASGMSPSTLSLPGNQPTTASLNCTGNATDCHLDQLRPSFGYGLKLLKDNKAMLMRTFYVLLGVTLIVIVYFGVRTIRWRSRSNRIKRYGLLAQNDDRLEMQPLDQDDDDEDDMTVFDINRK